MRALLGAVLCGGTVWALPLVAAELNVPKRWNATPATALLQVHELAPGTWVLRQGKQSHFEAPFMYLIAGKQRALLLDSGAPVTTPALPLRDSVDRLLAAWGEAHAIAHVPLVVAHTHGHGDHHGGDGQFADRAETTIVATDVAAVSGFWGLPHWPDGEASLDLGGRALKVLPLPGHEVAHIAVYDAQTASVFSGDSVYPGLLTIRDWPAFQRSMIRLDRFVREHGVRHLLGAHVEMSAQAGVMYPLGSVDQPDEHALVLTPAPLQQIAALCERLGDFVADVVRDDFALTRIAPSAAQQAPDSEAVHGMLLFGRDVTYLSHLPMFHRPHDYQLIARVELPAQVLADYQRDAAAHPAQIYTLVPTRRWVLRDTIKPAAVFTADLYRGHFERGGALFAPAVSVRVSRIEHFRRFSPGQKPDAAAWIAFGNARERYLAHRIEGAPDSDQVIALEPAADPVGSDELRYAGPVAVGAATPAGVIRRIIHTELDDLRDAAP